MRTPAWCESVGFRVRLMATALAALSLLSLSPKTVQAQSSLDLFPEGFPNSSGEAIQPNQPSGPRQPSWPAPQPLPSWQRICPADLEAAMSRVVDHPTFTNARWGILVETVNPAQTIYSRNPDSFLIPASNVKLLTTAAALQTLYRQNINLAAFSSRIEVVNRFSDNYVADALLRQIGGVSSVQGALTPLGIDPSGYRQVDGSGLSRSNLAKPTTLIAVLRAMQNSEARTLFTSSLPVAGYTGTLRNRFVGTPVQGRLHAKTGTLSGVRALSGYLDHEVYGTLLISVVVNQPGQAGDVLLWGIDNVVLQIARLGPCEQTQNPLFNSGR